MNKNSGFTLIELIIVIVLLGILAAAAAPRFADFSDEAEEAAFRATGAAFREGVNFVHYVWVIRGNGQAAQDFIPISDPVVGGDLSVNEFGYPADTRGSSLTLNSQADCEDVWRAVLSSQDQTVDNDDSDTYRATYNGANDCTYALVVDDTKTITYNSNTGRVDINF